MTPIFNISLDGQTLPIQQRLVSLEISDHAGIESDTLRLILTDPDGALELPRHGVELIAAIGFAETGLVDKGLFIVDEVEYSSPPNTLTISARATDFRGSFRKRREASYHETTLGKILETLASRNDLTLNIHADLSATFIAHIDQTESDLAFMHRITARYDATAAIKQKHMVIMPKAEAKTLSGQALPTITIQQQDCTSWRLSIADRDTHITGVSAKWQSNEHGNTFTVTAGENTNSQMLPQVYPTQTEAIAAAQSELKRRKRAGMSLDIQLAMGNPDIIAESPVSLSGFKNTINGADWITTEVQHTLNNQGLQTRVRVETK